MNPSKLGGIDNHRQEPWKLPLPAFIEHLYEKRFGKTRPDIVTTIEERARALAATKAERKARKLARKSSLAADLASNAVPDEGGESGALAPRGRP